MNDIKKIIILGKEYYAELLFYGIEISDYSFDISGIYDVSEKTDDFHGLEVLKLSALNEVNPSEVHYVFNYLTYDYEFEQTLKIYFGVEKVKRFSDIEGFLNKKQRMELMKKRALMDSPKLYNPIFDTLYVKNRRKCRQLLRLRLLYIFREKRNVLRNSYNSLERLIIPAIAFGVVSSLSVLNPALSCNASVSSVLV